MDIPIYYINVDNERNNYMQNQLNQSYIPFKRIQGYTFTDNIDKMNIFLDKSQKVYFKDEQNFKKLVILSSHLKAIQQAYQNKEEYVIISEDDIDLEIFKNTKETIFSFLHQTKKDMVQLHSSSIQAMVLYQDSIYSNTELAIIKKKCHYWGATFYYLSKNGIQNIMKYYNKKKQKFRFRDNIKLNHYISDYLLYSLINSFLLNFPAVNINRPDELPSSIQTYEHIVESHLPCYFFINREKKKVIDKINSYTI